MLAGKNKHFNDESCLASNKFRMEEAVMSVKMQNKTTWARISAGYCVHLHSFRVRLSHLIGCYRPPIHGTIYTTGVKGILIGGLHSQKKEFACKKRIIVASSFFITIGQSRLQKKSFVGNWPEGRSRVTFTRRRLRGGSNILSVCAGIYGDRVEIFHLPLSLFTSYLEARRVWVGVGSSASVLFSRSCWKWKWTVRL